MNVVQILSAKKINTEFTNWIIT